MAVSREIHFRRSSLGKKRGDTLHLGEAGFPDALIPKPSMENTPALCRMEIPEHTDPERLVKRHGMGERGEQILLVGE